MLDLESALLFWSDEFLLADLMVGMDDAMANYHSPASRMSLRLGWNSIRVRC